MAWSRVTDYHLGYNIVDKQFYFYYQLENEPSISQIFVSAVEVRALADMFRNEGPVNFNSDGNYFVTAAEAVGEGETVVQAIGVPRPLRPPSSGSS